MHTGRAVRQHAVEVVTRDRHRWLRDPVERNPVYRESIDNPGRRFKVEGTEIWSLFLEGSLMF